jgi:uncharacterized membrane protein
MGYGNAHELAWLWMLVPTVLLLASVALAAWVITRTTARGERGRESSALSTLGERYARGEISKDDFDEARRTLGLA